MLDNLAQLKTKNDFLEVHKSKYYRENFVKKYINNIPRLALEVFGMKLTYQQVEVLEEFSFEGGRLVVPSGHCMAIDTPIMLSDGSIKKVQDLKITDKLMGDDGKSDRNILSLCSGIDEMYEFELYDGTIRTYNQEHILCLVSTQSHGKQRVNDKIEVKVKDYIKWSDRKKRTHCFYRNSVELDEKRLKLDLDTSRNVLRVGVKKVTPRGAGKYYGFALDKNHKYLDGDYIVSHNSTGKTRLIGVLTFAYLLLFPKSIVRIIAPTEKQVTTFSFKEIRACIDGMKSPRKYKGKVYESKWSFLAKFFVVNKTLIYVKRYEKEWQIHPATAPIGKAENLAGLHNKYLLLVFDEASGIDDLAIGVALGAVSERVNSAIMFSQHTRTSGKFHNFVTVQNIDNGGVWKVVRLSSEESPIVSAKEILSWKATYDENEYNVKVLGLPPLFEDGFLLNTQQVQKAYSTVGKEWIKELEFKTVTISVDIAFVGLRDSGIITTMLVATRVNAMGRTILYIIVKNIQKFQGNNKRTPIELMGETEKTLVNVSNKYTETNSTKICVDATSGGTEAFNILEERVAESIYSDTDTIAIRWGTGRLVGIDKKRFINQRAKAYIMMKEAVEGNRVYFDTDIEQTRVLKEMSHIPFKLDSKFRYQMLSKKEMAQQNIPSPDIVDTISQAFLVDYIIDEDSKNNNYNDKTEEIEEILEKQTINTDEEVDMSEEATIDLIGSLIM